MGGVCGQTESESVKVTKVLRNGMDYEAKKTYPPDYSNVPSVRDWQMSPFGNERYDLDEIQRAEKKGFKGRFELEAIKQKLAPPSAESSSTTPSCPKCKEREDAQRTRSSSVKQKVKCSSEYLYQPYGPSMVSSLSYNNPMANKPRLYSYLGPSKYAGFRMKVPAPSFYSTIPCSSLKRINRDLNEYYIPYGPFGEMRMTEDMYIPMGPSIHPLI